MGCRWILTTVIALVAIWMLNGCDLGWDFLKEGGGGGNAGAQTGCQSSQVVTGQFPPSGALLSGGTFTADYTSPQFTGQTSPKALGLRVSRNRLWLNDLSIEVSFFPIDNTTATQDPRNGCLGRAILEINIPFEDVLCNNSSIFIQSTRISQTEASAFYAEGGDPGFTSDAVQGTISLNSTDCESSIRISFELTFNPGTDQRLFTNGQIDDDIDQNPAAEGR